MPIEICLVHIQQAAHQNFFYILCGDFGFFSDGSYGVFITPIPILCVLPHDLPKVFIRIAALHRVSGAHGADVGVCCVHGIELLVVKERNTQGDIVFTGDRLAYGGWYYLIGEGHKEFIAEEIKDEDYYLLTLVAIAKELKDAELTEANIVLAAGLPLTWTSGQKKEFAAYQCALAIREMFMQKTQREINDAIIEEVLCTGTASIPAADIKIIRMIAKEYVDGIFRRLREHGYYEGTMMLYITGGGGCLVKNFGMETARRMWGDDYEIVVTTHLNTDNIHNHIVVNSVSFRTGRKFENHISDHYRLREISDAVCQEYGKSVLKNAKFYGGEKGAYWVHKDGGMTHRDILRRDIDEVLSRVSTYLLHRRWEFFRYFYFTFLANYVRIVYTRLCAVLSDFFKERQSYELLRRENRKRRHRETR